MAGGIERMASAIMNEMCKKGHDISLLTWDQGGAKSFYELDENINWKKLSLGNHKNKAGWKIRLNRALKMRNFFSEIKPDVAIAFQHGTFISTRLYTFGMNVPIISAEREAPARFEHLKAGKWQWLIYQSFRLAKIITIQCEGYRKDYHEYLRKKTRTISNPVFSSKEFASPSGRNSEKKQLLCVGRLGYQKNQQILIKAFAKITNDFPEWELLLAGEGGDRNELENEVNKLKLQDKIHLPGAISDTHSLYCQSHLFCLPSRWEGFPNVVAEAMSHGLPVVGYAGCAGTNELIEDGVNGLLAEGNGNIDSLAECLGKLMSDGEMREKMGKAGIESMKKYKPEIIFGQWENLFKEVAGQ